MPVMPGTHELKEAVGEFDFAVDGGAVSQITLRSPLYVSTGNDIPAGSVIEGGYLEVDTLATSGGTPAVSVDVETAGDVIASGTLAATGLSTTGRKSVIPSFTGATTVKTTVRRQIKVTIGTAALTAGKFRVVLFYR